MNLPPKMEKDKKITCILEGKQSEGCLPVQDKFLPLCDKHKTELNQLTAGRIADYIRNNFIQKGDEALIFNQKNGGLYSLNPTGTFIFKELLAGRTFCEILLASIAAFNTDDIIKLAEDYKSFIEDLYKFGLLGKAHE